MDLLDALVNFDFANPDLPSGRRYETTVPQQALFLMNSPVVVEQAKRLVSLKAFDDCVNDKARIQFLYERIYQRPARPEEIKLAQEFIAQTSPPAERVAAADTSTQPVSNGPRRLGPKQLAKQQKFGNNKIADNRPRAPLTAWQEYAHALLQANEASFLN